MSIYVDEVRIGKIDKTWKNGKQTKQTKLSSHFVDEDGMYFKKILPIAETIEETLQGSYKCVVTVDFIER